MTITTNLIGLENSGLPYFTLTATLEPKILTKTSQILSAVKEQPKLTQAFRLEIQLYNLPKNAQVLTLCCGLTFIFVLNIALMKWLNCEKLVYYNHTDENPPDEDGPFVVDCE